MKPRTITDESWGFSADHIGRGGFSRPGGSVGNIETFSRWDVSSNLGAVTRTGIIPFKKLIITNNNKNVTSGERLELIRKHTKYRLHDQRGKGTAEFFSREK